MFDALGNIVAYQIFGLDASSRVGTAVHFFVMDISKIFAMLAIIIYVMGLLRALLSAEKVRTYIRDKPIWLARILAIMLGAITPFCSCSSIPLFIGFVEAGIPLSITFSFLIASPMINEVAVFILIGILGWKMTALYVIAGLTVAYVGGVAMKFFKTEKWVEDYVWRIQMGNIQLIEDDTSLTGRHHYALGEVKEIFKRLWKWIIIGIAVGALFHGFVPETWIVKNLGGDKWLATPLAVLLGIPLYSNATGVIPIAEAMMGKGVAIGTTLAFMMSIAALSLPEMLILRKVIKWPALAIYASILAIAFTLVGWGFNLLNL